MFRESTWRIIWDPEGASPLVLLDFADLMDGEIRLSGEQMVATGKSDFARRARPMSRANVKRRVEFSARIPHATGAASWAECITRLKAAPWGLSGVLSIEPRDGEARRYDAALLDTTHRPSFEDGIIESVHTYAIRIIPNLS